MNKHGTNLETVLPKKRRDDVRLAQGKLPAGRLNQEDKTATHEQ